MRKLTLALAALFGLIAGSALAHGPSRLKTEATVLLDAPLAEVWKVVGTFEDLSWWPEAGTIAAEGNDKGALRKRTLANGQLLIEELLKRDDKRHALSVRLVEDNLDYILATNYALHLTFSEEAGKTKAEVKGAFYRAFPQNDPPADQNDEASTAAVEALHQTLIEALVGQFGAGS